MFWIHPMGTRRVCRFAALPGNDLYVQDVPDRRYFFIDASLPLMKEAFAGANRQSENTHPCRQVKYAHFGQCDYYLHA